MMSDAVKIALIEKAPAIATAVLAGIGAALGGVAALMGARNGNKLNDVHIAMNSRMDQLVAASRDSGRIAEQTAQALKTEGKDSTA